MGTRLLRVNLLSPITSKLLHHDHISKYRMLALYFRSIVHRCSSGCCRRSVITGPCPAPFTHLNIPSFSELIQTEDIFTAVRDALRAVNKLDLDKLISSVSSFCY